MDIKLCCDLFNALVRSTTSYACEVWVDSKKIKVIEVVYWGFFKSLLKARKTTSTSRVGVDSSRIPRYLKVCTSLIVSPSNTNFLAWVNKIEHHDFFFFTFIVSPRSGQNHWSMFNYCYSPTSNYDVKVISFVKNNNHTCKFAIADASHSLSSKRPSKASKYSPNNMGLRRQPYFTPYWHLKLEVTPSLGWLMRTVSSTYITYMHHKKHPSTLRPSNTCHNTSCDTISNVFFKSTEQQWSGFFLALLCSIRVRNMKS